MFGRSVLSRIFAKMNTAVDTKACAETLVKLENLVVTAEKRIDQLKCKVVEIQKDLEEHKAYASNVLVTEHTELLEENKKLKREIEEWKKKVFAMEGKLGKVEIKVRDSVDQNEIFVSKISAHGEILNEHGGKINLQGEALNKYGEKIALQEAELNRTQKKIAVQEAELNRAQEKITLHEEKLNKTQEMLNASEEKLPSGRVNTKEKKTKKEETPSDEAASVDVGRLDIRIGKILNIKKHPDADTLYVEQIDVGEEKPRNVVSGLVKFIPMNELQNRMVVVVCNMKPSKMRGILSEAMVLCANDSNKVEVLNPPKDALPGDKVLVEGYSSKPDSVLNPKKKIFETVALDLKTDLSKRATYKGKPFYIPDKGIITSSTLTEANIK